MSTDAAAPRVVLTMIVKDEAHVIERCIASVRPFIHAYCIVDTGSTDDTIDRIHQATADLPGEVHQHPWRDFAFNRSQALDLARSLGTHSLMIDADDTLTVHEGVTAEQVVSQITHDVHHIAFEHSTVRYSRPLISSTRLPFRFRGVLHEFLETPEGATTGPIISGVHISYGGDGARARSTDTRERDAKLLLDAIERNDEPELRPRYTFYLAQSWRDGNRPWRALHSYEQRTTLGGWVEEVHQSWLAAGHLRRRLVRPVDEVLFAYEQANRVAPWRAEGLYYAALTARQAGRWSDAVAYASRGIGMPEPPNALFLEPLVYTTGLAEELAQAQAQIEAQALSETDEAQPPLPTTEAGVR